MAKTSKPATTPAPAAKTSLKAAVTSISKTSVKPAMAKAASAAAPVKAGSATKAGVKGKAATPSSSPLTPQITMTLNHDQIAKRAFAIWVAKGRPQGQDEQNWKEAEALLARDMAKRA